VSFSQKKAPSNQKKGCESMKIESMPIFRAIPVITNRQTIFHTLDRKIVIEMPGALMKQLIQLCNGTRTNEEIVLVVGLVWLEGPVRELLDELYLREILVDARHLDVEVWKAVRYPIPYLTNLTNEEVTVLVQLATKQHRTNMCEKFFKVEPSSLNKLLTQRRSVRSFTGESVAFQSIINILWSAYGELTSEESSSRRTVPSAGALYPLIIHLVLFNKIDDLESSVYRVCYSQNGDVGLRHVSDDVLQFARSFLNPIDVLNGTQGVIVVSGSLSASGVKYGNRSILYVPLEAGHIAQNIHIEAIAQRVATLEIGSFVDELLGEAIKLTDDYRPLTTIVFGTEDETSDDKSTGLVAEIDWAIPMSGEYRPPFSMASVRLSSNLGWSHGRDPSPNMALTKAVSESKEWTSCGCIPALTKARFSELESAIDPRDVLRFHDSQYQLKGFPFAPFDTAVEYQWAKGYEVTTGLEVSILADHVYFPYHPETQYYAYANSSGCAAYPDEQKAIETATLELVERDSFMNSYLTKIVRPTIAHETLPLEIRRRIESLQAVGFKVWVKDHSLDLAPVVLVFAQSDELTYTTCASCSSFDVVHAVSHALMEVEASVISRLQNGYPLPVKPRSVGMPLDHGTLYSQKEYYRRANFIVDGGDLIPVEKVGDDVAHTWSDLIDRFTQKGWQLLAIPLHLSDKYGGDGDLRIVRCIVPGMVPMTFGFRQEPAGMERIYKIAKEFGTRTLTYGELTKFPHPFE